MKQIAVINGANMNMLGLREPNIYGHYTLNQIIQLTEEKISAQYPSLHLDWFQSNIEGEIIDKIHSLCTNKEILGLVINPGGFTHTSIAIYDALKILSVPAIEVHLSNVFSREKERRKLITSGACHSVMAGLGQWSYYQGIFALYQLRG